MNKIALVIAACLASPLVGAALPTDPYKTSDLPAASALGGTEMIEITQSGASRRTTPAALGTYLNSHAPVTVTDTSTVGFTLTGQALSAAVIEAGVEGIVDLQDLQGAVTDAQVPDSITVTLAATATALTANGNNCSPGSYPLGTDASGAVESCTDATTEIDSAIATHAAAADPHTGYRLESADIALGTSTSGNYVSGATASQGLTLTGTEGASLGLQDCAANEVLKRNAGDTAWDCAADTGGSGVADGATLSTGLTFPIAGLHILDTNASHDLIISPGSNITADRTLTITTGDANRTVTVSADSTISGSNTGDQTISLTGDVTGSGTGSFAATIAANSVALTTDTTGNYVSSATASQGLTLTGTEGASLGLQDCAANEIMKRNAGDTAWDCAADTGGGGVTTATPAISGGALTANWNSNPIASFAVSLNANLGASSISASNVPTGYASGRFEFDQTASFTIAATAFASLGTTVTWDGPFVVTDPTVIVAETVDSGTTWRLRQENYPAASFDLADFGSGSATADYVPKADGSGGVAWGAASGGVADGATLSTGLTFPIAGLHILDTNASHDLIISPGSNITADRTLTFATGDANRTVTVSADSTISGSNTGDQTITLTGDVTGSGPGSFAATIAANSVALTTDTTGNYVSSATANQGLTLTGTEGASLGLQDCAANEVLKRDSGDTAWACAADAAGGVTDGDKGDITASASGATWTIDNSAVTLAKMANINQYQILARTTASAGAPEAISSSANMLTLLQSADYSAARTNLGLAIGSNVQAYDADLTTYAGITPSANIQTLLGSADYSAARTNLGLAIGANVQAYDADLTSWAAISPSGALDFGGSTSFEAPNGANPTTDTAGEIAVDTSTGAGQGIRAYGAAAFTLPAWQNKCVTINAAAAASDFMVFSLPYAATIQQVTLNQIGATNVVGQWDECDSAGANCSAIDSTDLTATTTKASDTAPTNAGIDAGDVIAWRTTSVSGTNTQAMACIDYTVDQVN